MLSDVDLKYAKGGVALAKRLDLAGGLTVAGAAALPSGTTVGGQALADPNIPLPSDHGLVAWSYDPSFASTGQVLTGGVLYLSALRLRKATSIAAVWWAQSAAGVTPTSGQNFACLINSAGAVLSSASADSKVTGSGPQSVTLAAAQNNLPAGLYWVGLLFNAATPPTLARTNGIQTAINNANLSGASLRFATSGTAQTALPGSITPANNAIGASLWVGAS